MSFEISHSWELVQRGITHDRFLPNLDLFTITRNPRDLSREEREGFENNGEDGRALSCTRGVVQASKPTIREIFFPKGSFTPRELTINDVPK